MKIDICKTCGFNKNAEREFVIFNKSRMLSQLIKDHNSRCPECNHYKDGSTIRK